MTTDQAITTERLILAPFEPAHEDGLFAMNSDPNVMRYLSGVQSREATKESIERVQSRWEEHGFSWWAVLLRSSNTLIGAACLQHLAHEKSAPLEIGWRLMTAYHGHGYATEAGGAAMNFGFERIGADYLCAVAHQDNIASQKVMQRLGMTYVGIQTHYDEPCAYYEAHKSDVEAV